MTIGFTLSSLLAAGVLLVLAAVFGIGAARRPDLWKTLPRERVAGTFLALGSLAFSAWQAQVLLEGGLARYMPFVWLLVPVLTVLACLYLDFLLTRALGGVLMLLAPQLLQGAFDNHLPARPAFSAVCYLCAVAGVLLMAAPWRFRDLLERAALRPGVRRIAAGTATLTALVFLLAATFNLMRGSATP